MNVQCVLSDPAQRLAPAYRRPPEQRGKPKWPHDWPMFALQEMTADSIGIIGKLARESQVDEVGDPFLMARIHVEGVAI